MPQSVSDSAFRFLRIDSQRWRLQIFVITWLAYAAFYFTRKAFSVAKLGIGEDAGFALDKAEMANLDALYLGAYAVGQFVWGVFADRYGPRAVVLGGLLVSALAALLMGTFATLPIFAACMVVQGLAQATGWPGLCKNLGSFFGAAERGRVLGLWSSCYAFGGLVAAPFGSWWAYRVFGDWRAAFIAAAAVVLAVAVLFFLLQRNRPQDVGLPALAEEGAALDGQGRGFIATLAGIRANRVVLMLGLVYFLLKPACYTILLWGPAMVYERMPQLGKVTAALLPSAFEIAGLIAPLSIVLLSDRLFAARRFPVCVLGLLLLAAALTLFVPAMHGGNVALVAGLLFATGLVLFGLDSLIGSSLTIDFGRGAAGTASGFVNGCGASGAILGGLLPGYFDTENVFLLFSASTLLAGLLLLPLWNRLPQTPPEPPTVARVDEALA